MTKRHLFAIISVLFLFACNQTGTDKSANDRSSLSPDEQTFLNNLESLCGKSFLGSEQYIKEGRESWAHKKFVMHVTKCDSNRVHIPFHLDEDHSRTWMFMVDEKGLRFRHDHRHEDGTPEDVTLYGGYADGTGNAFVQHFPADEYTKDMLADTNSRKWNIILGEDMSSFTYELEVQGELVFSAKFDLTIPVDEK
jgi:hypothetical protein